MLVSFETENEAQQHVDVLTQDIKQMFGKLDKQIKKLGASDSGGDNKVVAQVRSADRHMALSVWLWQPSS